MGTTAETSNLHPPGGIGFAGDGPGSPLNHRRSTLASPWAQVVRGEAESAPSPDVTPEQTSFRDCSVKSSPENGVIEVCDGGEKSNAARSKPVWSKPSNGAIEAGAVMGAESWPALSESTRAPTRLLADSSSKNADGLVSTSQAPTIQNAVALSHDKQAVSTVPSSTPNHALPVQQRHVRRGGGGGGGGSHTTGGGHSHRGFTRPPPPPPPPPFPIFQLPPNSYGTLLPPLSNSSPRGPLYRAGTWETRPIMGFVPQPHIVNDHRSDSRRGNYHNTFGNRRDHTQPQRGVPRGIVRPPPASHNSAPFITPQTVRPFPSPIGFSDAPSQLVYYPQLPSFGGVPFITPQPPPFFIPQEKPLSVRILDQIEFYFSDANLMKDDYLKSNMDDQGWVPISLIAGFPRVKGLTNSVELILDSLRSSIIVEVQDDKLRRRNEWMKWMLRDNKLQNASEGASGESGR